MRGNLDIVQAALDGIDKAIVELRTSVHARA